MAAAPAAEAPAPSAAAEDDTTDCAICLRPVREGVRLRGGQQYTCTHVFHTHCFEEWSQTNQSCPICRSPVGRPARSPVRRRPPAVTTEGHFFVQLPDEFHNQAMRDAGRLGTLGRAAIFCINGAVRPEMVTVQRARGLDRAALSQGALKVLRFFFVHGLGPAPVVLNDLLVMPGHGNPLAILHASICAAACAALRVPGFVVVDAEAAIPRVEQMPAAQRAPLLAQLEDPWAVIMLGRIFEAGFSSRDMLDGSPRVSATRREAAATGPPSPRHGSGQGGGRPREWQGRPHRPTAPSHGLARASPERARRDGDLPPWPLSSPVLFGLPPLPLRRHPAARRLGPARRGRAAAPRGLPASGAAGGQGRPPRLRTRRPPSEGSALSATRPRARPCTVSEELPSVGPPRGVRASSAG